MGRAPCCDKASVKRGPWSPEEDMVLKDYVEKHGNGGSWIALPQKAGLKRCGKSCRLRWLNYLRPDIKHGSFTEEEDNIICTLYKCIGSRWSVIASHLPRRTDNDVKNHWNTKLKKKLLAEQGHAAANGTGTGARIRRSPSSYPPARVTLAPHSEDHLDVSFPTSAYTTPPTTSASADEGGFGSSDSTPVTTPAIFGPSNLSSGENGYPAPPPSHDFTAAPSSLTANYCNSYSATPWSDDGDAALDTFLMDLGLLGALDHLIAGGHGLLGKAGELWPGEASMVAPDLWTNAQSNQQAPYQKRHVLVAVPTLKEGTRNTQELGGKERDGEKVCIHSVLVSIDTILISSRYCNNLLSLST